MPWPLGDAANGVAPPWPDPELPTTHLWPPGGGRRVVAALPISTIAGPVDLGDGASTLVFAAAPWCLTTSPSRRSRDLREARHALAALARTKVGLGELMPPDTALAIASRGDEHWLWTIAPWSESLRVGLDDAFAKGEPMRLVELLSAWVDALVAAVELARRRGIAVDLDLQRFTNLHGRPRYLDDRIGEGLEATFGRAVLAPFGELDRYPDVAERYYQAITRDLPRRIGAETADRLGLLRSLDEHQATDATAASARCELMASLGG